MTSARKTVAVSKSGGNRPLRDLRTCSSQVRHTSSLFSLDHVVQLPQEWGALPMDVPGAAAAALQASRSCCSTISSRVTSDARKTWCYPGVGERAAEVRTWKRHIGQRDVGSPQKKHLLAATRIILKSDAGRKESGSEAQTFAQIMILSVSLTRYAIGQSCLPLYDHSSGLGCDYSGLMRGYLQGRRSVLNPNHSYFVHT